MSQASLRRSRFVLGRGPGAVAFVLVLGLLLVMAIEPTRQLLTQRERVSTMAEDLAKIERVNAQLEARIDRLKDPDYIEQQARAQAGLVHPGEVPYVVMPPSDGKEPNGVAKQPATTAPPPEPGVVESFLDFIGFL